MGRRAVYASWGLSRTYLPSLKRKLGPFPCPRLVPAPGRVVQVTATIETTRASHAPTLPTVTPNSAVTRLSPNKSPLAP